MVFIPAEIFRDSSIAKGFIEFIDVIERITPREDPTANLIKKLNEKNSGIMPKDKGFLLRSNRKHLETELTDDNMENEVKRFIKSREIYNSDLGDARKKYISYQVAGNALDNRFVDYKKTLIKGVGVDGSGEHPKNYRKEIKFLSDIEEAAKKRNLWNIDHEDVLKESIANVLFWQSSNFSNLAIGTPTQVASFVIELINCGTPSGGGFKHLRSLTGGDLIVRRKECNGLQYLLEGNKFDIDDLSFNGKAKFLKHTIRRLFYSSDPDSRGIMLKCGAAKSTETGYQLCTNSDDFMMNESFYKNLMKMLNNSSNDEYKKNEKQVKFGAIMLIYAIFFSYISYINNLYEILINEIKNEDLKLKYNQARLDSTQCFLNLVNYAIKKYFKLKIDFEDMIIATATESENKKIEENSNKKIAAGPGKSEGYTISNLSHSKASFDKAIKFTRMDEMRGMVYIGFKNASNYEDIFSMEGSVDDEKFTKEKYPIVFTDPTSNASFDNIINYEETIKRLVPFLLRDDDDKVPTMKDGTPIAVGAPFQNNDILEETAEALDGWYTEVIESKSLYLQFMQQKISIFNGAVPAAHLRETRDMIFNQLNIIGSTVATTVQKDIECLKIINKIISKYRDLRKQETRLVDDKSIMLDNKITVLGNKPEDYPKQTARAMKRLHYGIEAILLIETAKLSYQLFREKNPGMTLCSNFEAELDKRVEEIDNDMNSKVSKILLRIVSNIEKKFGPNALRGTKAVSGVLQLSSSPTVPKEYIEDMFKLISGAKSGISSSMSISTSFGKKELTYEQRAKVETEVFWRQLYGAFNSRFVLIPVIKLRKGSFSDDNLYLIDLFNSMIAGRIISVSFGGNIRDVLNKFYEKAYIMFSSTTNDLDDPSKWRAIDHNVIQKILKSGSEKFINVAAARDAFFNLIANAAFFKDTMVVPLPPASNTSKLIQYFCKKVLVQNKLRKCNILVSREMFAKNVQPKVTKFAALKGIDFASGTAFSQYKLLANSSNLLTRN